MNERLEQLRRCLSEIPFEPKPVITETDLQNITDAIAEASYDCDPKDLPWEELTDNVLKYEITNYFGMPQSLQEFYQEEHFQQWCKENPTVTFKK
jgi:Fe-S-cluster formation regulator IscX/YfhJ